jgi:2-polyprenyl-6-methoxyphenol hydroxylase-like FAD-dependent oxidoreductase
MLTGRKYDYELVGIHYTEDGTGVTAYFTNGEAVNGSIIVGSDGPQSKLRELLLGEKGAVTSMDVVHNNMAVTYHDAEKAKFVRSAHPVFCAAAHPTVFSFLSSEF